MTNPLSGFRGLECGQFIADPFAGMPLGDLYADLVKIKKPVSGDPFRHFGTGGKANACRRDFWASNRQQRSLTLDVAQPEGEALFRRMPASADLVLGNFRASVVEGLGLGPEALRMLTPRLVTRAMSGFSLDGPNATRRPMTASTARFRACCTPSSTPRTRACAALPSPTQSAARRRRRACSAACRSAHRAASARMWR
jgi:crotonobetainyl-CoA:carnitine CoA-transferase CaiB-like acyl-CoA transferase